MVSRVEGRILLTSFTLNSPVGVTADSSGDLFVSYNSASSLTGQAESVKEYPGDGSSPFNVFTATGAPAFPGSLATLGTSAALPNLFPDNILELQPDGEMFAFNPTTKASLKYDAFRIYTPDETRVFDLQTGTIVNLSGSFSLSGATFSGVGVDGNAVVVGGESSNGWDFVMRVVYTKVSGGVVDSLKILAASPASDGLSKAPEGVAVNPDGTVLTTLPYLPAGSATAVHLPLAFDLYYDQGGSPAPEVPTLGLPAPPSIYAGAITADSSGNFYVATTGTSLMGGPGYISISPDFTQFQASPELSLGNNFLPYGIAVDESNDEIDATVSSQNLVITHAASDLTYLRQYSPGQIRHAYGVDRITFPGPSGTSISGDGTGQTIAIVAVGFDPTIVSDLHHFDQAFGLPDPPSFVRMNQGGSTTEDPNTIAETALDVEWAHAIAPGANILLYDVAFNPTESNAQFDANLFSGIQQAAAQPGVSVVSISYGIPETGSASLVTDGVNETGLDGDFMAPGVTFLAASGDAGIFGISGNNQVVVNYPAASPNVVAVGGTRLPLDAAGDYPGTGTSGEVGWGHASNSNTQGGSGGGLSRVETEPSWQVGVVPPSLDALNLRAVPDVALNADSKDSYNVYTTTPAADAFNSNGWFAFAGTSAATPAWAGLIAIADQGRALAGGTSLTGYSQTLPALYSLPAADFHDIVNGSNGALAQSGYDYVTGRGTPVANLLVPDLAAYEVPAQLVVKLAPPSSVIVGSGFDVKVEVEDRFGNVATGNDGTVTIAVGNNPASATLDGMLTVSVVDGIATFSGLKLSHVGSGFTLVLTAGGINGSLATTPFDVTPASTQVAATSAPAQPASGQPETLTASVTVSGPGTGVPTGSVTFQDGTTTLGTATLIGGVATLPTTLPLGPHTINVTYGGDANDQPSNGTLPLTVVQVQATISLGNLVFSYDGSPHTATASTSPAGLSGLGVTYTQNGIAVASPTQAGSYTVTASLANPAYTAATVTGTLIINQATPAFTWANPADITYGTPLGAAQLDAAANVPGTFTYTPAAGTVLAAGLGQTLAALFTPNDAIDYRTVNAQATLNVQKPTPSITWSNPADIVYGTPLGAGQLDASANVPGIYTYTPAAGTVLNGGQGQALALTFTPTDTVDYSAVNARATINVLKANPALTWSNPADIAYGTPLGAAQLDAVANVPGTFTYTPAAGTVLGVGTGQALALTFTPTDTTDFQAANAQVSINVLAPPTPPHVQGITPASRSRKGLTSISVAFDEPMDSNSAGGSARYVLLGGVKKGKNTIYSKPVGIHSVNYNGAANTVTIALTKPFKGAVQVTVQGGILAANGTSTLGNITKTVS